MSSRTDSAAAPMDALDTEDREELRERAIAALREGRFDLAEELLANGEVTLAALIENLRIYQAELEIQNEELQRSQGRSEQALARFTALFSSLPIAALVADRHGLVLDANPEGRDLFDLRNLSAHQYFLVRLVAEQDRANVLGLWNALARGDVPAAALNEVHMRSSAGDGFIADLHAARLPTEADLETRFVCAVVDRTEAVRQREEVKAAYERLEQSQEAYRVLAEYSLDWEYWLGPDGHFLYISPGCEAVTGYRAEELIAAPALLASLIHPEDRARWVAHTHLASDAPADPDTGETGVMLLRLCARDGSEHWIEHVCRPVISADGRYLGRRGVNRDVSARVEAERALRRSEAFLLATGQLARVGGWELELPSRQLRWTQVTRDLHEVPPDYQPQLDRAIAFYDPADRPRLQQALQQAITHGEPFALELRFLTARGTQRWVKATGTPRWRDGKLVQVRGTFQDISERVAADQALRASEARFRSVFDAAPLGIAVLDQAQRMIMANPTLQGLLGRGGAELQQLCWADCTAPEDHDADARALQALYRGEQRRITRDKRFLHRDGSLLWTRVTLALGHDHDGTPGHVIAMVADIGEQRAAELALRESEEKYRALFQSASEGMAVFQHGRLVSINRAGLAMLGHDDPAAVLGLTPAALSPPCQGDGRDSHSAIARYLDAALAGGMQRFEWDHQRADGGRLAVELTLIRVELGGAPALFATWHDLGPERAARERERRARTVFENTSQGVIVTDPEQRILAVNPAFTEITGYSEDEVLGQTPRLLRSARHEADFYRALWAELTQTGRWRGEVWNRRKSGELYPQLTTISAVFDEHGALTNYVAVFGDNTQLKRSEEALYRLAHHDALTGLPNRVLLRARVEQAIKRAGRDQCLLALLFLDLDMFKNVNDSLGHPVGDGLLQQVAQGMAHQVRTADSLARLGGDEFVVLMEDFTDPNTAAQLARRLLQVFARPFSVQGRELYITASIGISVYPNDGKDMDQLLANADIAMYQAKEQGRNTYRFFEAAMTAGAMERLRLEVALRGALGRGELQLAYQPQVRLRDRCMNGVEALLRWRNPDLGDVPPDRFIPVAEEIGMIGEIGAWVLEQGCRQMAAWEAHGFLVPRLAVNISVHQLERPDVVEQVRAILARTGITPDRLELEVTETVLMRQAERVIANLNELRDLGITLAVDDFGSGFSSLGYLKRLPIRRLKIDRMFIDHLTEDPSDDAISRAIIALGRGLGLEVIAEGVETEIQAEFLTEEGCHEAQGYLFGRPMAPSTLVLTHLVHGLCDT